jgi:hypothetical protein
MAFMNVTPHLGDQGVCDSELREGEARSRKLTDAYETGTELGQREDAAGKLADGDYASSRNGDAVGAVFEGDVQERQTPKGCLRFVLEPPPVPLLPREVGRFAIRTGGRLFGYFMPAYSTGFHDGLFLTKTITGTTGGRAGQARALFFTRLQNSRI